LPSKSHHNPTTNTQLQSTRQANRTKEIAVRLTRDADTLKMQPQVAAVTVDPVDVSSRAATVSCHGTWWQAFPAVSLHQPLSNILAVDESQFLANC